MPTTEKCQCGANTFGGYDQYCPKYADHNHVWEPVTIQYKCPTCNSILGEAVDGVFIRTRAGELKTWGNDLHILLTCHNEKPGQCYEQHTRMILVKLPDESFEFLPYEQYLKERIEGKRTN